jgi:hypothetical protein
MGIEFKVRICTLHRRDSAALQLWAPSLAISALNFLTGHFGLDGDTGERAESVPHPPLIEGEYRVDDDAAHRRQKLGIEAQSASQLELERDHPLAQRDVGWQDSLHQIGGGLRHPSTQAT